VRNNGCIYEGHCLDSKADGKGLYLQYDGYKVFLIILDLYNSTKENGNKI
jgi:hypothetical protein